MINKSDRFLAIVRHGHVGNHRGLSVHGLREVAWTADILKVNGFDPDFLITSPHERTIESSDILRGVFPQINSEISHELLGTVDGLDVQECLDLIPERSRSILLSGHAETIACFCEALLNDDEYSKLFSMMPESRFNAYETPKNEPARAMHLLFADALILKYDDKENRWALHGWISCNDSISFVNALKPQDIVAGSKMRYDKPGYHNARLKLHL